MKNLPLIVLCCLVLACTPQPENTEESETIEFGTRDTIYSEILGEEREVWVYVPQSGAITFATSKYPVLYLLDGDGHYFSVAGLTKQLSTTNGNTKLPKMIVVAILNTDRTRDLTPSHVPAMNGDSTFSRTSGGAANFTRFISEELMPHIDENYPTASNKTLVGHSFGGLFAINALIHHPDIFDNYVSIDPSLWWDDMKLLGEAKEVLASTDYSGKSLFVSVANTMSSEMDTLSVQSDTTGATDHIRSILEFSKYTEKVDNGLAFDWQYYPDDSHGSVPLITEHDGLRFIFSWYELQNLNEIFVPDSVMSGSEAVEFVEGHYKMVSEKFGYDVLPDEQFINSLGYNFMGFANEKSLGFFELNIKNFPQSYNTYDSMSDYYLSLNDTTNAIIQLEKALEIEETEYCRNKLNDLKGE